MKYAIIFAATAAASYDAYGAANYADSKSTTKVDYPTSVAYNTYDKPALKTVTPGYGKPPVTITSQYQPYQTCAGSKDGKSCDKWNDDVYVSTVIKDCDDKDVTVTKTEQVVTIYRTKTTVTNYATATPTAYKKDDFMKEDCKSDNKYNTTPDYKAACDKSMVYKNYDANCKSDNKYNTTPDYKNDCDKSFEYKEWCASNDKSTSKPADGKKEWYSLYEKSYECSFADLGPHALKGYPGSGLRKDLNDKQPVHVKEFKDGKWSEYQKDLKYGTPEEVKTYEKPGVYTNPSRDIYVDQPITKGTEAYATAKAGTPVTYGGAYTQVDKPCTVTGAYGAYETSVSNGKTITATVVKTATVYCASAGKCEIAKPTTTVYDVDTEISYPTAKVYQPGVYHYNAETVTITKANQPYTCEFQQTKTYDVSKETGAPGKYNDSKDCHGKDCKESSTKPACNGHDCENGHGYQASSVPSVNTQTHPQGGDHGYGSKPSATPAVNTQTYPHGGDHGYGNEKPSATPAVNTQTYPQGGDHGYGNKPSSPAVNTQTYPQGGDHGYGSKPSAPAVNTQTYPQGGDHGYGSKPSSTPSMNTQTYPHGGDHGYGNEKPSSTPSANTQTYPHGGDNGYGNEKPSSTPSMNTQTYPHGGDNGYGSKPSSTPCTTSTQAGDHGYGSKPSATPAVNTQTYPQGGDNGYGSKPSSPAVNTQTYPQGGDNGYGSKPSATPAVNTQTYPQGGDNGYGSKPSATPAVNTQTYPQGGDNGYGSKPTSTPCTTSTQAVKTDSPSHPTSAPSYENGQPTYGDAEVKPVPAADAGYDSTTPDAPMKRSFGGSFAARARRVL